MVDDDFHVDYTDSGDNFDNGVVVDDNFVDVGDDFDSDDVDGTGEDYHVVVLLVAMELPSY